MTALTLHNTMYQMSQRLDEYLDAREDDVRREESEQDEERALMRIDPLLVDLNKQSKDATANALRLKMLRGADDAMSVVAADMADSAKSAYETRLLELRQDDRICLVMKHIMQTIEEEREAELAETKQKFWDRMNAFQTRMREQTEKRQEKRADDDWVAFMFMYMSGMFSNRYETNGLRMAGGSFSAAFSQASRY